MQQVKIPMSSESRRKRKGGKKKGSARSQMLKLVMPELSSNDGKLLQTALQQSNPVAFRQAWTRIGQKLSKQIEDDE